MCFYVLQSFEYNFFLILSILFSEFLLFGRFLIIQQLNELIIILYYIIFIIRFNFKSHFKCDSLINTYIM